MADTLAPCGVTGVITPAMNTVVQPELEMLRPKGVTNQMQRYRLDGERVSEDLVEEDLKQMDCNPTAIAVGLTTGAGPGAVTRIALRCRELADAVGVPVCNASEADHAALSALGARRVTPFTADIDRPVQANVEEAGFDLAAIKGTEAPSLPPICETPLGDIRGVFRDVARSDCDAVLQVGTDLSVVALLDELEREVGNPVVACNAAVYWQTLRAAGMADRIVGFGRLLAELLCFMSAERKGEGGQFPPQGRWRPSLRGSRLREPAILEW